MKQLTCNGIGLALVLGMLGLPAGAQNQAPSNTSSSSSGSSLGDYARQVRKDPSAKAKPKVFDNDNLPTQDKLSIVGPTAASTTDNSASSQAQSAASTETKATGDARPGAEMKAPEDKPKSTAKAAEEDEAAKQAALKQWEDKMTSEKEQIDLLTRELDVLQREYQIRAAAMYADVGNRMRNSADWDKQDAQYKQQIADKQKALEDAKQKLEDLQEGARKAGVSASARE
jgi:hypothetical protein